LDDNGYQIINDLKEGMYFGEVSLLTNLRRTSTIYSVTPCFLGVIDKETFMKVVDDNMDLKYSLIHRISEYKDEVFKTLITMVKNTPAFRPLSTQIVRKIVYKLKQIRFSNKQLILRTGEYSDKIFFVMKGRVSVMVKDIDDESASQERLILLKHGCSFNFMGALMERPAIFDYVCGTLDQVYNPEAQDVFSSNQSPNNDASSPKNDPLSFEGG
jgi:CRP-like cAMP-binding protein